MASDIYSIGWWIESADDEIYGPASRATVARFIAERVISPNTLVRHCTEMIKRPAIDVPGVRESLPAGTSFLLHGDMLSGTWPRRNKERLALAKDSLPCGGLYYGFLILNWLVFVFRDRLFGNAGPGKRMLRLRVVGTADGTTPLSYGQAFVRWLALFIPVFGLIDLSVAFRDPLMRRYGDSWAGTRVIDTEDKLNDVRGRVLDRLSRKKGIQLSNPIETPMSTFARAVE
jgi:uncharacterized RDD family membrane protein YckC